ncbi:MAG: LPS export ABC transporter permease LptG [Alphaproteobacteria bacterium]|nr:LPS export ABC transporter permease LptG [Alphaproteobacteria bacterium]
MKMSATFSRYISLKYLRNTFFLLLALMGIIYLFDTVELIRRASKVDDVPLSLVMKMGLFKLPEVVQILFPFAILFGAMFTFWQLNRRQELVILRSAGFSVWQFLAPVICVAMLIGFLQIGVFNPVGALLVGKYERLEKTFLKQEDSQVAVFKEGLWLRQSVDLGKGYSGKGYVILNASRIERKDWRLNDVKALFFDQDDNFVSRLDGASAILRNGYWVFVDPLIHQANGEIIRVPEYRMPTYLTIADVEGTFASTTTLSFWRLRGHIQTLEATGFDASALRVHYHNLLSQPLFYVGMVLLAAIVSMRPPRQRQGLILFSSGVFIGFVVFFMTSFLQALGASQQIPVILAAWSPALICFLLGISAIINLEDG